MKIFRNKRLIKRFIYFGLGFSLGILFLSFGPENKLKKTFYAYIDYFNPNKRVISHLYPYDKDYKKQVDPYFSTQAECQIVYFGITKEEVLSVRDGGNVNFKLSDKDSSPCQYFIIENNVNGDFIAVKFEYCFSSGNVTVLSLSKNNEQDVCVN